MTTDRPAIEPIRTAFRLQFLDDEQLDRMQEATLQILEEVGVKFPSEKALAIFSDYGAVVDHDAQVVKISRDLVFRAMATVPRYFGVGAREPGLDFCLEEGVTYFTTDGCGVEVVDLDTGAQRPSCKADVGTMARVADYLPSIAFYWPMVSAQDYGATAPLHELDASWNNTAKHVQSETLMGEVPACYAVEMATVLAGSREALRERPLFSLVLCTIAPLAQDQEGIEGALVLAEAGIPVAFLAMPTLGTTSPATLAGAWAVGDAEIISGTVLLQLAHPGARVSHSIMHGWADPRSGSYVPYPLDARGRYAPVAMAHHWGMPAFGGAFGTESPRPGTWQAAADVACDPLLIGLAGAEWVTGIGLNRSFTLLYPESIVLDDELYHRARYALAATGVDDESLALDAIASVGPGGHYLREKHTRRHMRSAMVPGIAHQAGPDGKYRDPLEVAREKVRWILDNHHPEPPERAQQEEMARILAAADRELG
ncbi:MAG TPA: trimethylamine methyltransferase family protein [Anaerolineae bacterium]|nr:trimethylamine methyltransferase family protein [Anaerolineae bacterium]